MDTNAQKIVKYQDSRTKNYCRKSYMWLATRTPKIESGGPRFLESHKLWVEGGREALAYRVCYGYLAEMWWHGAFTCL
jgi:hypothetical protein